VKVDIVKISTRKTAVSIAAALALSTISLTGCSGGGGGGNNTAPPKPVNPPATKTYAESDLVKILTTANGTLNAGGTVTDLGPLSAQPKATGRDVYQQVISQGGTFTPAACGQLFAKVASDLSTLGGNTSAYSAKLEYTGVILTATSSSKAVDVQMLSSLVTSDLDALTQQCAAAQVTIPVHGVTIHATFSYATESATTDAAETYAYSETGSVQGSRTHTVAVIGLDGNLLISYEGISPSLTVADGVTAVNAVVAAANG
jgi:hypothetical protein